MLLLAIGLGRRVFVVGHGEQWLARIENNISADRAGPRILNAPRVHGRKWSTPVMGVDGTLCPTIDVRGSRRSEAEAQTMAGHTTKACTGADK